MEKMLEKNKKQEKKTQKNKRLRSRYLLWKTKVVKFDNKKSIWNTQEIYIKVFCQWVNTIIKENKRIQHFCGGFCLVKETIRKSYDALFNAKQFVLKTFDRKLVSCKSRFYNKERQNNKQIQVFPNLNT